MPFFALDGVYAIYEVLLSRDGQFPPDQFGILTRFLPNIGKAPLITFSVVVIVGFVKQTHGVIMAGQINREPQVDVLFAEVESSSQVIEGFLGILQAGILLLVAVIRAETLCLFDSALDCGGRLLDLGHPTAKLVHQPRAFGYLLFGQLMTNQLAGVRISAPSVSYYTIQEIGLLGSGVYLAQQGPKATQLLIKRPRLTLEMILPHRLGPQPTGHILYSFAGLLCYLEQSSYVCVTARSPDTFTNKVLCTS